MTGTPWQLADDAVDVWCADLAGAAAPERALLSADERARAERFADPLHGRRWAAARGILRALLGHYLDADPRALAFAAGPHGKPALAAPASQLRFNLSHAGDVALYALALDREVGVDVELPRARPRDVVALAARALGAVEAERLRALPAAEREPAFLRAWVRWEAALKCSGLGVGGGMGRPAEPAPWLRELPLDRPGAAALAVAEEPAAVRVRRWPPAAG